MVGEKPLARASKKENSLVTVFHENFAFSLLKAFSVSKIATKKRSEMIESFCQARHIKSVE